jgi:hypothetical protein
MVFLLARGNQYHFLIKGPVYLCDLDQFPVTCLSAGMTGKHAMRRTMWELDWPGTFNLIAMPVAADVVAAAAMQ